MFLIANTFAICFNKDYLLTYLLTYFKVTQGHRIWYYSIRQPWLPINVPYSNIGLSRRLRAVSEVNGDIRRKSPIFPTHPRVFMPPLKGFPFELGIGAGVRRN